ncbi:hypothetical protein ACO2Q3_24065 [Caulobacter sp. KR2-114]|uniref:hypothetical protein n=1 Tax=Caulobacter sp. KR2-114 TaxID=3400912 RepID=UPI003C039050
MAPISIALIVALMVVASVVTRRPPRTEPPPSPIATSAAPATSAAAPTVLGRTELIAAANAAAVAYAAGLAPDRGKDPLVGRAFRLRIPFGCDGPQLGTGSAQAHFELDPTNGAKTLVAQPSEWSGLPIFQGTPDVARAESVEGFWIPRPWMILDTCPPRRDAPLPATPTPPASQTLGLAEFFAKGSARTQRHASTPYQTVWKPKGEAPGKDAPTSFELVLEGRVDGFADGRALRCWSESADHRPICIFAVSVSRVAFEDAAGHQIAEWRR